MAWGNRWAELGTVTFTAGHLRIGDPSRFKTTERPTEQDDDTLRSGSSADNICVRPDVTIATGLDTGTYEVFATINNLPGRGERVTRVELRLVEDDQEFAPTELDLFEKARAAESNPSLLGSALAQCCTARGWSREDLADYLLTSRCTVAALYCEPRPVPMITVGPGRGRGVFTPEGALLVLADRYEVPGDLLLVAYREGVAASARDHAWRPLSRVHDEGQCE